MYLERSTGNLMRASWAEVPESVRTLLMDKEACPVPVFYGDERVELGGYAVVSVPDEVDDPSIPDELLGLLTWAKKNKYPYILFSPDEPLHDKIPLGAYWCAYILECRDGTYYTGATTDLRRRVDEHRRGQGSRYVQSAGGVESIKLALVYPSKSAALKAEAQIKKLSREHKDRLIQDPHSATSSSIREFLVAHQYLCLRKQAKTGGFL